MTALVGGTYGVGWINVLFSFVRTLTVSEMEPATGLEQTARAGEGGRGCRIRLMARSCMDFRRDSPLPPTVGITTGPKIPLGFTGGSVDLAQDVVTAAVRFAIGRAVNEGSTTVI